MINKTAITRADLEVIVASLLRSIGTSIGEYAKDERNHDAASALYTVAGVFDSMVDDVEWHITDAINDLELASVEHEEPAS